MKRQETTARLARREIYGRTLRVPFPQHHRRANRSVLFLLAITCGSLIRYCILSVLTVIFGPQIVTETASLFRQHPLLLMVLLVAVIVGSLVAFWLLRAPAADIAEWKNQENPDTKKDADKE